MARPFNESTKIVFEVLEKYPNTPTLTLAKKIYKENPLCFKSVEQIRGIINRLRGKLGTQARKELSIRKFMQKEVNSYNPFNFPEPEPKENRFVKMPLNNDNIIILNDVHVPYHDINSLNKAIQYIKDNDVNTIYFNGDLSDFYQISRYEKNPKRRSFGQEIENIKSVLKTFRDLFPDKRIYYKKGNHCDRWEKWLRVKAPELLDCSDFQLEVILKFGELKIEVVESYEIMVAGNMHILHGHEYRGGDGGISPAKWLYDNTGVSSCCGHFHRVSEVFVKNIDGTTIECYSMPCMSDLSPDYMPFQKKIKPWQLGFAHLKVNADKTFEFNNIII